MTNLDEFLLIGQITAPFGVRGQIKVKSYTDRPDHLSRSVRTVYLGDERTPLTLTGVIEHKPGMLVVTLREITSREAADALRGVEIYIRASEAAPLAEDEYFLHQLIGLSATTEDGQIIGQVREVLETGAGEVLVIARPDLADALVPMVRDFIVTLDIANRRIVIRPIEGLL
ncbi:MAG: ribosome maturation factor RimM [Oscillochloridaceae bacterium]|nr:ribosome maturation factor RimM [Chloroflexaceae bacterium]MDW8390211.1 ribosome maturation factor RimM [Oscillochloridaceae bacterium]